MTQYGTQAVPSKVNGSSDVPTRPPAVITYGFALLPVHTALVDDAHVIVEHSAEPTRPEGVTSRYPKFSPMIVALPLVFEAASFVCSSRELIIGASQVIDIPRW